MKKRILGLSLCALGSIALLTACNNGPKSNAKVDNSGKVFKIACWNEEFRGFFNKYSTDEGKALIKEGKLMATADAQAAKTGLHIDDKQYEVGLLRSHYDLFPDGILEDVVRFHDPSASVYNGELASAPAAFAVLAVVRRSGSIADDGLPRLRQSVKQGGLAHIRPSDDGY